MPMPWSRARRGVGSSSRRPSQSTSPSSGRVIPARTFMSVDFPAPFSPTRAWVSPAPPGSSRRGARAPRRRTSRSPGTRGPAWSPALAWTLEGARYAFAGRVSTSGGSGSMGVLMGAIVLACLIASPAPPPPPIDRQALMRRHEPVLLRLDPESPLSVGNGELAFTADVTGLQTFPEEYEQTIPLATLAQWGWHTAPNPNRWTIDRFRFREFESH